MRTLLLIALLSFSACTTAPSSSRTNACDAVPLIAYTKAQQATLGDEVAAAPSGAVWPDFVRDYGLTYQRLKACQSVR